MPKFDPLQIAGALIHGESLLPTFTLVRMIRMQSSACFFTETISLGDSRLAGGEARGASEAPAVYLSLRCVG